MPHPAAGANNALPHSRGGDGHELEVGAQHRRDLVGPANAGVELLKPTVLAPVSVLRCSAVTV